jgi:hypothetical protein
MRTGKTESGRAESFGKKKEPDLTDTRTEKTKNEGNKNKQGKTNRRKKNPWMATWTVSRK